MIGLLLALAGLGLGIAVLAVVWVVVHRDFGARRLMVDDLDIYRSANELIKERGLKGASDYAADRIAALLEMNDNDGANVWRRIRAALLDLSDKKFKDDPVN